jgi:hypothetical protein
MADHAAPPLRLPTRALYIGFRLAVVLGLSDRPSVRLSIGRARRFIRLRALEQCDALRPPAQPQAAAVLPVCTVGQGQRHAGPVPCRASAMPGQCHAGPVPCRASALPGQCRACRRTATTAADHTSVVPLCRSPRHNSGLEAAAAKRRITFSAAARPPAQPRSGRCRAVVDRSCRYAGAALRCAALRLRCMRCGRNAAMRRGSTASEAERIGHASGSRV